MVFLETGAINLLASVFFFEHLQVLHCRCKGLILALHFGSELPFPVSRFGSHVGPFMTPAVVSLVSFFDQISDSIGFKLWSVAKLRLLLIHCRHGKYNY